MDWQDNIQTYNVLIILNAMAEDDYLWSNKILYMICIFFCVFCYTLRFWNELCIEYLVVTIKYVIFFG